MLTYMALPDDPQDVRAAKLKALQAFYKTSDATAFAMLPATGLSRQNAARGDILVVNSHGNAGVFAGYTPEQFLEQLRSKGFEEGAFSAVYLMACQVGVQAQDNSILNNFARDLKRLFVTNGITAKLYAPRGMLSYQLSDRQVSGQTIKEVTDVFIRSPERNYPLGEGVLLVV